MKKTVTITLAVLLTAVSGWGVAQVSTLRGSDAGAADSQTFADKQYQGKSGQRQFDGNEFFNAILNQHGHKPINLFTAAR